MEKKIRDSAGQLSLFDHHENLTSEAGSAKDSDGSLSPLSPGLECVILVGEGLPNWGIRSADLQRIREYRVLEDLFYGIHNLVMPIRMMDALNPDEILAKYIAAGQLKRNNAHFSGQRQTEIPRVFIQLCQYLDREAYPRIGNLVKGAYRKLSHNAGDQVRRLESLPKEVQNAFIDSFFQQYKPSIREEPHNPKSFYDPNIDGRARKPYINALMKYFRSRWEQCR